MTGAIVDVSSKGGRGCGPLRGSGVTAFEALSWSSSLINQNSGEIGSRIVQDSFIPGVKFGIS